MSINVADTNVALLFELTVVITVFWLYKATKSLTVLIVGILLIALQSLFALQGAFQNTKILPPPLFLLGVLPSLVLIVAAFATNKGRAIIDNANLRSITLLHSIRVLVEIALAMLCTVRLVPVAMTFNGTNFDIFSGLSAPVIGYLAFRNGKVNRYLLIVWNIICLLLLMNVVITAVLSIPTPFQMISLEQPNVAVLNFPFNLLPSIVVPVVLFCHLVAFRQLRSKSIR